MSVSLTGYANCFVYFEDTALEISSSKLSFRIAMIDLDELKPHEEVIESVVASLAKDFANEEKIRDPLIVDRDDYVILDGMHRFSSLKLLRCSFIPCCLVDYTSALITVGSWFRTFNVNEAEHLAQELLDENQLTYSKTNFDLSNMSYNPDIIALTKSGTAYSWPETDPIKRSRTAVRLEIAMVKEGHAVTYLSEIDAFQQLRSGRRDFVIPVPILKKEQIREIALMGRLLPHKVTRHVIPSRPLSIDVPLELLTDHSISSKEASRKLGEFLAHKHFELKPAGSVVDGRKYEEELLVFSN